MSFSKIDLMEYHYLKLKVLKDSPVITDLGTNLSLAVAKSPTTCTLAITLGTPLIDQINCPVS